MCICTTTAHAALRVELINNSNTIAWVRLSERQHGRSGWTRPVSPSVNHTHTLSHSRLCLPGDPARAAAGRLAQTDTQRERERERHTHTHTHTDETRERTRTWRRRRRQLRLHPHFATVACHYDSAVNVCSRLHTVRHLCALYITRES